MKKPFEGKPCPEDEKLACIKCGWYLKDEMGCKLGYIRDPQSPVKHPGKDEEYDTEW